MIALLATKSAGQNLLESEADVEQNREVCAMRGNPVSIPAHHPECQNRGLSDADCRILCDCFGWHGDCHHVEPSDSKLRFCSEAALSA